MKMISNELAEALGGTPESFLFLRQSQNRVYAFSDERGAPRILRMTADSHRRVPEIEDELAWLCDLDSAGLSVCPPVQNPAGGLIHFVREEEELFHAVIFERAPGRALAREDLSPELYYLHGKHLGQLHAFSRKSPRNYLKRRKPWDEERYFTHDIGNYLPKEVQDPVREMWVQLRSALKSLPVSKESHGPVHLDLGYSNFFINGDSLELFDFDNCALGYYANDVALALYGGLFTLLRCEFPGDRSVFEHPKTAMNLGQVWAPFREGYRSESPWPEKWNETMTFWFEMAYFRSVIHAFRMQFPVTNPNAKAALDVDIKNLLNRQPPLRFDFQSGKVLP